MGAGKYREQATFERQTDDGTLDAYGNPNAPAWQAVTKVRVDFRETTGKERIAAGRLEAPATGTLRVRASSKVADMLGADRVQLRGHIWKITGAPIYTSADMREMEFALERGGAVK